MVNMRFFVAALCIVAYAPLASAQNQPDLNRLSASQPINDGAKSPQDKSGTGPLTTGTGGATAANPQGGTPPNMQAKPEGSTTSVDWK
jgi:hypothetical protein